MKKKTYFVAQFEIKAIVWFYVFNVFLLMCINLTIICVLHTNFYESVFLTK